MLNATVFSKLVKKTNKKQNKKTLEHEVNTEAALPWLSVRVTAKSVLKNAYIPVMNQQINQDVFGLTTIDLSC